MKIDLVESATTSILDFGVSLAVLLGILRYFDLQLVPDSFKWLPVPAVTAIYELPLLFVGGVLPAALTWLNLRFLGLHTPFRPLFVCAIYCFMCFLVWNIIVSAIVILAAESYFAKYEDWALSINKNIVHRILFLDLYIMYPQILLRTNTITDEASDVGFTLFFEIIAIGAVVFAIALIFNIMEPAT